MFDAVAPGYDRANQILSFGIHHRWRKRLVRLTGVVPGNRILDCACGTGDLAFEFERAVGDEGRVVGVDFSPAMIHLARAKGQERGSDVDFMVSDVLSMPFGDGSFDGASIAFGIRNVDDPVSGLREMARVVRPGGCVAVLEFGQPDSALFARLYRWYGNRVIPRVGGWITGKPASYRYLTATAATFPSGNEFLKLMRETRAFASLRAVPLTMKIAYMYVGIVA